VLLINLNSDYTLVTHLKMTGQLIYVSPQQRWGAGHPNNSFLHELPDKSTRVEFVFSDDSRLYFNDQRKFGWVKLVPTVEVENIDFMRRVGPEPLEDAFTAQQFILRLHRRRNTTIKAAILDQTVLAGVGNIYADESLWGAKIHPATRVRDVSDTQLTKLLTEIKSVMILSIEKGGSTDKNYRDAEGRKGSYLSFARVFRREGKACPRCGSVIEKLRVAGRGTHICPVCQKLPVH
jgi:formamidopyrimidine-DNA glycosylase